MTVTDEEDVAYLRVIRAHPRGDRERLLVRALDAAEARLAKVRVWARGHSCATPRAVTDLLVILGDERALRLKDKAAEPDAWRCVPSGCVRCGAGDARFCGAEHGYLCARCETRE